MEPLLDADYTDDVFGPGSGMPDSPLQLPAIGSRVVVGVQRSDLVGTVHFVGPTLFAEGDWIGIELDPEKMMVQWAACGIFSVGPRMGSSLVPER